MDDVALLTRFENATLGAAEFGHREHVRLAWVLLQHDRFETAALRYCAGLRRFAASLGKPDLYHETITWAYLALVNERILTSPNERGFDSFAAANPDLLDHKGGAIASYYDQATLHSELARKTFLLPRANILKL